MSNVDEVKLSHRSRKRIKEVKKKARPGKFRNLLNFKMRFIYEHFSVSRTFYK
jgi:hypothetical protein